MGPILEANDGIARDTEMEDGMQPEDTAGSIRFTRDLCFSTDYSSAFIKLSMTLSPHCARLQKIEVLTWTVRGGN